MKKKIVIGLLICLIITYVPIRLHINNYAQSSIKKESRKEWEYKVNYKDSVFNSIRDPRSGSYYCALYHNMTFRFENLDTLSKDEHGWSIVGSYDMEYLQKQKIKIDKSTYFCNPNFNAINIDFRELFKDIKNINESKGRAPYLPLEMGNYQGWFQTGWAICYLRNNHKEHSYCVTLLYPAVIELKNKANDALMLDMALKHSYDYYTKNENSAFTNCDNPLNLKRFMEFCLPNNNECYYKWVRKEDIHFRVVPKLEWTFLTFPYFNIHLGHSDTFTFELKLNDEYVERRTTKYKTELINKQNNITLVLGGLLVLCLIMLILKSYSENKRHKETILQRIIKTAHPKQFLDNYDKDKLEIANEIYDIAIKTNEDDKETIVSLSKEVEEKLGLYLIPLSEIKELREKCNPKHFMNPYDAQKVKTANELYSKLNTPKLTYTDYVSFIEQISKMYHKNE